MTSNDDRLPAVPDEFLFTHQPEDTPESAEAYREDQRHYGFTGRNAAYADLQLGQCPDPHNWRDFPQWAIWGLFRQDRSYQALRWLYFTGEQDGFFHYTHVDTGEQFWLATPELRAYQAEVRASCARVTTRIADECGRAKAAQDAAVAPAKVRFAGATALSVLGSAVLLSVGFQVSNGLPVLLFLAALVAVPMWLSRLWGEVEAARKAHPVPVSRSYAPQFERSKMFYSSGELAEFERERQDEVEARRRYEAQRAHETQVAAAVAQSALLADIAYNEHRQTRMMQDQRDVARAAYDTAHHRWSAGQGPYPGMRP